MKKQVKADNTVMLGVKSAFLNTMTFMEKGRSGTNCRYNIGERKREMGAEGRGKEGEEEGGRKGGKTGREGERVQFI